MGPPAERISGYGGKKLNEAEAQDKRMRQRVKPGHQKMPNEIAKLCTASKATELSWAMTEFRALGLIP